MEAKSVTEDATMEIGMNGTETTEAADVSTSLSEEEDTHFQDIILLVKHGIPECDVEKLKNVGIHTIKGVQMTMKKNLLQLGFTEVKIKQIQETCVLLAASTAFMTAMDVSILRKQIFKISTGSIGLDKMLGGGIEAMSLTEVFGEFSSGKTQLAHTLCVTAQMPNSSGYLGGKVIFIDTEHTFRPDRLRPIADRFNLEQNVVLENILYSRAYNSEHQYELLNNVAAKLHEEGGTFKLLIVDSIMALFRADYSGIGEIADRQKKLAKMLSKLQKISEEYNIAVFITNQITSDFSGPAIMNQPSESKPIGGNILAHASTTRLAFKKGLGPERLAVMFDSPELEAKEVKFAITVGGIDDVK